MSSGIAKVEDTKTFTYNEPEIEFHLLAMPSRVDDDAAVTRVTYGKLVKK